jgi:adenylate cyclase
MKLQFRRFNSLLNPLSLALRLMPVGGRLMMLALSALVVVAAVLMFSPALNTLEERLGAQGWLMLSDQPPEERITVVAIDEASLAEIGPWPWSREVMADLTRQLELAGAQLQLHDIVYPEARDGDDAFLAALQSARGTVLAQVPVLQSAQTVRTGLMTHPMTGISCQGDTAFSTSQSFVAPHSGFVGIAKGHIAPLVASDGTVREVPAFVCVDGQAFPALALSALFQATNARDWAAALSADNGWFGPELLLQLPAYPGLSIPLDGQGNLRVSYRQAPENFHAVSAADVINGRLPAGILDNTWVLVGATAFGMGDIVPTPYNGSTAGVEIQARLLTSLLDARMPYTPQVAPVLLTVLAGFFAAVLLLLARGRERISTFGLPIAALAMPLMALSLHWYLLATYEIWLGWLFPAMFALIAAGLLLVLEQGRLRAERSRVFGNLSSYLPSDVAREIAFSLPTSSINAKRCDVTLLSADLRNFSAFGEARPPEESAALLHMFFVKSTQIIEQAGGRIHEFKGDGLLAVWDGQTESSARKALDAAMAMQQEIQRDLPQQPPAGLEPLALGIGIEQGPALLGSIGPAQRRTHTLLGDTVTITLRIQEMTAELAHPILLGECVARQLIDLHPESQGSYLLDGLRTPHTLFAPANQPELTSRNRAEQLNLKIVSGGRSA